MIVAVKSYFEIDAKLNPEQAKVTVEHLQRLIYDQIVKSHPFRNGWHFRVDDTKVKSQILEWAEVQKRLKISVDDITTAPKPERKTRKQGNE